MSRHNNNMRNKDTQSCNSTKASAAYRFTTSVVPWLICGLGALFYCYAYFLRVSPSVMMQQLLDHFDITASQFGLLGAFYYYSYTPMQLPVGVIVDRYGARLVLTFAALICTAGVALFASSEAYSLALAGRFLIGFGSAFGYITTLKLATLWLPPRRFATAAGATTAVGMTAAGLSQLYLTDIIERVGFQHVLNLSIFIGLFLTVTVFLLVRNRPLVPSHPSIIHHETLTFRRLLSYLKLLLKNKQIWLIGTIGCLMYLPASVFLDLWGIPYLKATYALSAHQAASVSFTIFVGWIIGGPVTGAISDAIGKRRLPLMVCNLGATIAICLIFYAPLSLGALYIVSIILGFLCGSHPLCFALSCENISGKVSATAVAVTNTLIMLGGMIFQPIIGKLLDWRWDGILANGSPLYSSADFTFALSIIPIGMIVCAILIIFLRETHCRVPE